MTDGIEAYEDHPCFEKENPLSYSQRGKLLNLLMNKNYESKVQRSEKTIKRALRRSENPIISSSFGKDSVVLIHLVHQFDDSVPIVFNQTGVQFGETLEYKDMLEEIWDLKIHIVKPNKTFWEIVDEYGYPKESRNSKTGDKREPKCCKILKTDPMKTFVEKNDIDMNFVGLCGDEGRQRRWAYIQKGSAIYEHKAWGTYKCIPLIWWQRGDIWRYIEDNDLPKNPVYDKYDIERTGCITCTGHKEWQKDMRRIFPNIYQKICEDLGIKTLEAFC